jgi:hypothetical protein
MRLEVGTPRRRFGERRSAISVGEKGEYFHKKRKFMIAVTRTNLLKLV